MMESTACLTPLLAFRVSHVGVSVPFGALLPAFLHHVARRVGLDDAVARRISPVSMWRRRPAYHLERPFLHGVNVLNACVEVNGPLDHVTAHHNAGVPVFVAALDRSHWSSCLPG